MEHQYDPGHIGAIIGKKTVTDETVLLVTDANRRRDGKVAIFEVDKSNYVAVLGGNYTVLARDTSR